MTGDIEERPAEPPAGALPTVLVHILCGPSIANTIITRRYLFDIYDTTYDPTLEDGPYKHRRDLGGTSLVVAVDHNSLAQYDHDVLIRKTAGEIDVLVTVVEPARPQNAPHVERLRRDVLGPALRERAANPVVEAVMELWDEALPGDRDGTEASHSMARMSGHSEVYVACARTGEGISDALDTLVMRALAMRSHPD